MLRCRSTALLCSCVAPAHKSRSATLRRPHVRGSASQSVQGLQPSTRTSLRRWRMASQDRNTLAEDFVAHSAAMVDVLRGVDRYARARTPLVLVGASGTGKTTVAELIHRASGRSGTLSAHTAR